MKLANIIPIPVTVRDRGRFTGKKLVFNCPRVLYVAARRAGYETNEPWTALLSKALHLAIQMEKWKA